MKNSSLPINILVASIYVLSLFSCKKDKVSPLKNEKKFVVDKIYDYNRNLVAEYFYDDKNKLIKKVVTEHLGHNYTSEWAAYSDEFEYENELVSKIIHKDISYNSFNYETHISYNSKSEIVKTAVHKNGQQISSNANYTYQDNHPIRTIQYTIGTTVYRDSIIYDDSKNVVKYLYEMPESDLFGDPIPDTKTTVVQEFRYDKHSRPNFNLDYLFIYDPLPFHEEADLQRRLSSNNMNEFINGSKWTYTYNEFGLPATIEFKWNGAEPTVPMLLRLTYKEVE